MKESIKTLYKHTYKNNNELFVFVVTLLSSIIIIFLFGKILLPILTSIIIAYLLDGIIIFIIKYFPIKRIVCFYFIFFIFISLLISILVFILPVFIHQAGQCLQSIPEHINNLHSILLNISDKYPSIIGQKQIEESINAISNIKFNKLAGLSQSLIKFSLASLSSILYVMISFILVPVLTFFFLKDKHLIIEWCLTLLPNNRNNLKNIWITIRPQLGIYVKGKTLECLILIFITYINFIIFHLNYSLLLAILVGLSVFIPYIGITIISIPVFLIALSQLGFVYNCLYMLSIYFIIQILDGHLLVPLLFSETLSLHPLAVIISIIIFDAIWGFWGLFFAIPLAIVIQHGITIYYLKNR